MALSAIAAAWFFPLVCVLCLYTCFTDMARMKITNQTVVALFAVFVVIGPFVLPLDTYLWRYVHMIVALIAGMALNAGGAMGAGDAKFIAAAAPFIHLGDLQFIMFLFAATLAAALVTHRTIRKTRLRNIAPDWVSWNAGKRFPMGLALGPTLAIYLGLGALYGS